MAGFAFPRELAEGRGRPGPPARVPRPVPRGYGAAGHARGFLSWFSLYFGLAGAACPTWWSTTKAPGAALTGEPYTATLFIPATRFADWAGREEAADFVHRYAPAHVGIARLLRGPGDARRTGLTAPPVLPDSADQGRAEGLRRRRSPRGRRP